MLEKSLEAVKVAVMVIVLDAGLTKDRQLVQSHIIFMAAIKLKRANM